MSGFSYVDLASKHGLAPFVRKKGEVFVGRIPHLPNVTECMLWTPKSPVFYAPYNEDRGDVNLYMLHRYRGKYVFFILGRDGFTHKDAPEGDIRVITDETNESYANYLKKLPARRELDKIDELERKAADARSKAAKLLQFARDCEEEIARLKRA